MKKTASQKEKYIWNMMGSLSNAFVSVFFAAIVNRLSGPEAGGIFAFAFSNAQLMLTIGTFEVRPLQSTDVLEKYTFIQYFSLRVMTCTLMMAVCMAYILAGGFTKTKAYTMCFLCFYKMTEGYEDVFAGMFQQYDRIDLAGKLLSLRILFCATVFFLALYVSGSLVLASLIMGIVSGVFILGYDVRLYRLMGGGRMKISLCGLCPLVRECLPLFISAFMMMYMNNAPKYAMEAIYSDEIQNIYHIIYMCAFVVNLFSLFVFRPMLIGLAREWGGKRVGAFVRTVGGVMVMIVILTILGMGGAYLCGIPALQAVYSVDLSGYRMELVLVMATGGVSAMATFMYYIVTVMRRQRYLLAGYTAAFLVSVLLSRRLVKAYAVAGAVLSCAVSFTVLSGVLFAIIAVGVIKASLSCTV